MGVPTIVSTTPNDDALLVTRGPTSPVSDRHDRKVVNRHEGGEHLLVPARSFRRC